jgi:hypothetical protein
LRASFHLRVSHLEHFLRFAASRRRPPIRSFVDALDLGKLGFEGVVPAATGRSAIVVFGEPDKWRPSDDVLEHTKESVETLVRLGECVALGGSLR